MMIGICDHRCTFLCPSFGWCHSIWQLIIEGGSACTPSGNNTFHGILWETYEMSKNPASKNPCLAKIQGLFVGP